jgi:anti-sigma B factor antagonist
MASFSTSSAVDGVTVVAFPEQVLGGPEAVELADIVRSAVSDGQTLIVFDLSNLAVMNSTGLGMLVSALTSVRGKEAQLRLANIPSKVDELLTMTQLNRVFDIRSSVDEAIAGQ